MVLLAALRGVNECVPLRGPNFCDTAEKWPLAEIFATAKFARHEADFSLDTVPKECLGQILHSLENIRIFLFQQKVKPSFANFGPRTHNPLYGKPPQASPQVIGHVHRAPLSLDVVCVESQLNINQ